jgi:hypothetical protein
MAVALARLLADDGGMKKAVWIWIVRVISLCVLGPIAGGLMSSLRAADGSGHATALVSGSLIGGVFALIGVFFLAMIGGIIATKMVSLREGVLNTGFVVAWGAWGGGQVGEALRSSPGSGSLVMLAIEGAVVLVLGIWVLVMLSKASGTVDEHDSCVELSGSVLKQMKADVASHGLLVVVGLVVSMVLIWLQVQSDLSGQSVWGGFIGAVVAGVGGGFVIKNHSLKKERSGEPDLSLVAVMVGVMLGAVVGPLVSMVMPGGGKILEAIASGEAPGWMLMSSLAWSGGAMIGVPVGYSWVESSVARQQVAHAKA